ncbi:MAG TPA: DUF3099 domain-containing protein [Propionibacterium sp.]|nr:DUF3099 domain-containing protein [Propionibacterium sp.]
MPQKIPVALPAGPTPALRAGIAEAYGGRMAGGHSARAARRSGAEALITDARHGRSKDLHGREVRYLITMSFRVACFIAMIFVPNNVARLFLIAGAAFLPAIAVLFANAVEKRSAKLQPIERGEPEYHRALPREATEIVSGEVVDD